MRQEPTFAPGTHSPPPRHRKGGSGWGVVAILLLAIGAAVWFWFSRLESLPDQRPPAVLNQPDDSAPTAPAAAPAVAYPPPTDAAPRAASGDEVQDALRQAVGSDAMKRFLDLTDFPRRFVATVDNLGRDHAPRAAWPVLPTPGRFLVQEGQDATRIAPENADRYRPFVDFAASLDAARVVGVYRRLYPVLQQAYRELGFGDRSFHERVIAVADLLLATPEPQEEPRVSAPEIRGPVQPAQPWTQYEFADPALQSLSAGQKILLRVGPENRRKLKAKIREIRTLLVQPAAR